MATLAGTKRLQFAPKAVPPPIKQEHDETPELVSVHSDFDSVLTQRQVAQVMVNQASNDQAISAGNLPQDPADKTQGQAGLFDTSAYYAHPAPRWKGSRPREPDRGNNKREPTGREDSDHSRSMVFKIFIPHTVIQPLAGRMGPDKSVEWLEVFQYISRSGGWSRYDKCVDFGLYMRKVAKSWYNLLNPEL